MFRVTFSSLYKTLSAAEVKRVVKQHLDARQGSPPAAAAAEAGATATAGEKGDTDSREEKDMSTSIVIIDVRTPNELNKGMIPGAHNIPVASLSNALSCDEEDFEDSFGFEKPHPHRDHLLFYCAKGMRSEIASNIAEQDFKFACVSHLGGGFEEWEQHVSSSP